MGLFKSLLESLPGDVLSQVKEVVKTVAKSIDEQTSVREKTSYTPSEPPVDRSDKEWHAFFAEILATEFPSYTVRQAVPVTDLAGFAEDAFQLYSTRPLQVYKAEWGAPYTFVMYDGAAPKGIVMLGSGHSHDSNVKYLISRMYAKKMGLPYINFYTQMPNERAYVISRINKFLG